MKVLSREILVRANILFQQPKRHSVHGHHQMVHTEIRLIVFFAVIDVEAPFSQQMYDKRAINTYTETSGLNWQSSSRVWHSI